MGRIATSKAALWFLLISAAYWSVTLIFEVKPLIDILNGALLGIACLVSIIYAPLFWRSVAKREMDRVGMLALGILGLWIAFIGLRTTYTYYRLFGNIRDALTNPFIGYFVALGLTAGVLHVIAPGYPPDGIKGKFGGRYRWFIIAAIAAGTGAAFAATGIW